MESCLVCGKPLPLLPAATEPTPPAVPAPEMPVSSRSSYVLRLAGMGALILGFVAASQTEHPLASVFAFVTWGVMAVLLFSIAAIRDLAYDAWKRTVRIEDQLNSKSRRR